MGDLKVKWMALKRDSDLKGEPPKIAAGKGSTTFPTKKAQRVPHYELSNARETNAVLQLWEGHPARLKRTHSLTIFN